MSRDSLCCVHLNRRGGECDEDHDIVDIDATKGIVSQSDQT